MKKCCVCKELKGLSKFAKDKHAKDGLTHACKKCRNDRYNKWAKDNPDKAIEKNIKSAARRKRYYATPRGIESSRRTHLKHKFGITLEKYEEMSESQGHVCAICGSSEMNYKNKVLCVDHNHETGALRGLLCGLCNMGIGGLQDNIKLLEKSIIYLKQYKK